MTPKKFLVPSVYEKVPLNRLSFCSMISTFFSHVLKPLESDSVLLIPIQVPTRFGISSTSDIILQTDDFNYIIGIMVDFPIEREEFQDLDSNGYWNDNEPFEDMNGNGVIDYHDYNNDGLYNKELKSDGSLYYEGYDNPKTSGLGKFVLNDLSLNYNSETFTSRCDGIIIDNFPHDANYFSNQILAVKNYYNSISNGLIDFDFQVIDSVYTVSDYMEKYSYSD